MPHPDSAVVGRELKELMAEVYPICRSITGGGVGLTLEIIRKQLPLGSYEVPSGTPLLTEKRQRNGIFAALKAMADCLRAEVNRGGVRVLSVFLGQTATPMQAEIHRSAGRTYEPSSLLQPEDVARSMVGALKLPRTAELTEMHLRPMTKPH